MKNFTIKNKKALSIIKISVAAAFCLALWQLLSMIEGNSYFLPSVSDTFKELLLIIKSEKFVLIILATLFRVIAGLVLGILAGIVLGIICYKIAAINMLISPIISIIKATPVASFIVLLWIKLSGSTLAILISFMMVLPIVWHSTVEALKNIPHQLLEVSYVFDFPVVKKIKLVYLPTMAKYLFPAFISSVGFAWKSEIATEIIAYTTNSIGHQINDGKFYFNTPAVYAWTLIVIILSLLLEKGTAVLLERIKVNA